MRVFLLTWGVVVVFFFVVVLATAAEHDHSTTDEQKRSHPSAIDRGTQGPFQSLNLFLLKKTRNLFISQIFVCHFQPVSEIRASKDFMKTSNISADFFDN